MNAAQVLFAETKLNRRVLSLQTVMLYAALLRLSQLYVILITMSANQGIHNTLFPLYRNRTPAAKLH